MELQPRFRARTLLLGCLGIVLVAAIPIGLFPGAQLATMALLYLVMFVFAWWLGRRGGVQMLRLDHPVPSPPGILRTLAIVPALTAVNFGGTWLLYYPLSLLRPELVRQWLHRTETLIPDPETRAGTVLLWVTVIVLAPVTEELVFRGLLLHRWCRKWGRTWGILLTTALFAVLHASPLGIFLLALGLTGIYLRTGSLRLTMVAHGLNNLLAFVAGPWVYAQNGGSGDALTTFQSALPVSLLLLIGGALTLWLLRDRILPAAGTPLPYDRNFATRN
ncbi:MAG: type II CAAX endopeptidase family protein [Gemmatimonadota bacterium]